jgi:UDPglucose 6-dehydrogenase
MEQLKVRIMSKDVSAAITGMGFVGLTTATVFTEKGVMVYGIDNDADKIKQIAKAKTPFYEPGLEKLLKRSISSGRFRPTTDLAAAINASDIIFICVGTPMRQDGSVNLDYIEKVSREVGKALARIRRYVVVCVKSTVPPGTTENIVKKNLEEVSGRIAGEDFGLAMTPEFLREGSAVADSQNPHLIVVGSGDKKSGTTVRKFFSDLYGKKTNILETNIVTAEMIKYANNSFLATKISFINTIANICNRIPGADVDVIASAIGADPRIGRLFLAAGPGYGGSCFPKDVAGFIDFCSNIGYDPVLLKATDVVNKQQVFSVLKLLEENLGHLEDKTIAVLGTAFKKNTDDIRESVSIKLIQELLKRGAKVRTHDPMALDNTRRLLKDAVEYSLSLVHAIKNVDCIVLMTDWDDYRILDRALPKHTRTLVIDTRRALKSKGAKNIKYVALGRS